MALLSEVGVTNQSGYEPSAFVLCGGLGTRLRSVVSDRPKSMALIGRVPFLELLLRQIRSQGITEAVLGTGYMAEKISCHFGDGERVDLRLSYSRETQPLGTGGALKLAETKLRDPILVLNGDSYVEWDLSGMIRELQKPETIGVMALQEVSDVSRYGTVKIDSALRISGFSEKGEHSGKGLINAGVYLLRKELLNELRPDQPISLEREVFPRLAPGRMSGFVCQGSFIDIGVPEDLARAQHLLAA